MVTKKTVEPTAHRQWFRIYKPTQGYWTRLCTAIGAGLFVLWGASWLFGKLSVYRESVYGQYIQAGVSIAWILVWGYVLYWVLGRNAKAVDFFISVEGEMKKVNWSSRQEVTGATKVVIMFVALLSIMLVVMDTLFLTLFREIGVLKISSGLGDIIRSWLKS